MSSLPVKLVCPRCRREGKRGRAGIVFLKSHDDSSEDPQGDRCPGCGLVYPRIERIHCVPPDLEAMRRAQAGALNSVWKGCAMTREIAAHACSDYGRLEPGSESFREAFLPGIYAAAHFPEGIEHETLWSELTCNLRFIDLIRQWLATHQPRSSASSGCALDVGCGPGRLLHVLALFQPYGCLGFDLRVSMLRIGSNLAGSSEVFVPFRVEGSRFLPLRLSSPVPESSYPLHFVQGDIVSPPFETEVFPIVSAVSLLDTVSDPVFVLGQVDALVCPGGLLLLGAPYHWEPWVTPPAQWLSTAGRSAGDIIRLMLTGCHPGMPHLDYEILEEKPNVPWALPSHGRLVHRFFLDVILARKKG